MSYLEVIDKSKSGHDTYKWTLSDGNVEVRARTNAFEEDVTILNQDEIPTEAAVRAKSIIKEERR